MPSDRRCSTRISEGYTLSTALRVRINTDKGDDVPARLAWLVHHGLPPGRIQKRHRTIPVPSRVPSLHRHDIEDVDPGLHEVVRHPCTQVRRLPPVRARAHARRRTASERNPWNRHEVSGARCDALVLPARVPARPRGTPRRPDVGGAGLLPGGRPARRRCERIDGVASLPRRVWRDRGGSGAAHRAAGNSCPEDGHRDAHHRCIDPARRLARPRCRAGRTIQEKRIPHNTQTAKNAGRPKRAGLMRRAARAAASVLPWQISNLHAHCNRHRPFRVRRADPRGPQATRMHCFDPQTDLVVVLLPVVLLPVRRAATSAKLVVRPAPGHLDDHRADMRRRTPFPRCAKDCNPACRGGGNGQLLLH